MSKQRKNYPLRLPEELFNEVKRWAEAEMRSVNGQIEFILKQAVNKRKTHNPEESTFQDFPGSRTTSSPQKKEGDSGEPKHDPNSNSQES